jgi:hypothetical protein
MTTIESEPTMMYARFCVTAVVPGFIGPFVAAKDSKFD